MESTKAEAKTPIGHPSSSDPTTSSVKPASPAASPVHMASCDNAQPSFFDTQQRPAHAKPVKHFWHDTALAPLKRAKKLALSQNGLQRTLSLAATTAVGLALVVGCAYLGHLTVTPWLLNLAEAEVQGASSFSQVPVVGFALSALLERGGPFGSLATVALFSALGQALLTRGSINERLFSWGLAMATLGLALSPLLAVGTPLGALGAATCIGAAHLVHEATRQLLLDVRPQWERTLMSVSVAIAIAPVGGQVAAGTALASIFGQNILFPVVAGAVVAVYRFWQAFSVLMPSQGTGQDEGLVYAAPDHLWPDFNRIALGDNRPVKDLASAKAVSLVVDGDGRTPPPSLFGLDRVKDLANRVNTLQSGDAVGITHLEKSQWLFVGDRGLGKRATVGAIANYLDAKIVAPLNNSWFMQHKEGPAQALTNLLEEAKNVSHEEHRWVVVPLYDMHELFPQDPGKNEKLNSLTSSALTALEGTSLPSTGAKILVIGTTNHLEKLTKGMHKRFSRFSFPQPTSEDLALMTADKIARKLTEIFPRNSDSTPLFETFKARPTLELDPKALQEMAQQAHGAGMNGSDVDRYTTRLIENIADEYVDRCRQRGLVIARKGAAQNSSAPLAHHQDEPAMHKKANELLEVMNIDQVLRTKHQDAWSNYYRTYNEDVSAL